MRSYLLLLFFLFPLSLYARQIHVPDDQQTIQRAIEISAEGDTVLVHPGTYTENIDFLSKSITVGSLMLTTGDSAYVINTIIDGDRNGESAVQISNVENEDAFLSGLTITNSLADFGGGVNCLESVATIENCLVRLNTAYQFGGGIACISSSMFINNCTIQENETDNGGGGGIYCDESTLAILYCNISYNSTDIIDGGGIYSRHSNPYITNCTIAENSVDSHGGGVFCRDLSEIIITNTILWDNLPQEIWIWEDNRVTITYSDIEGGAEAIVTDRPESNLRWREGNFDFDPLFEDIDEWDLRLSWDNFPVNDRSRSPCIDRGDPESPLDPDYTRTDIGAFYYPQPPAISVSPDRLEFTDVRYGQMSWLAVDIQNSGGSILRLTSQTIIPDGTPFVIGYGGGEVDLLQGTPHQTWVRFFPPEETEYSAIFRIESNDVDDSIIDVQLNGSVLGVLNKMASLPNKFAVCEIYPNPFNYATKIAFSVPVQTRISLSVFNLQGEEVAVLVNDVVCGGNYLQEFNAGGLETGVYFVVLEGCGEKVLDKLVLIK